jgi:hypothetical protein
MQLGSVFIWKNFPHPHNKDGNIKDRYFIYVGESHFPINPVHIFLITTTTRKIHYGIGGSREKHNIYKFKAGSFGFVKDSILDLDSYYTLEKGDLDSCKDEIEVICKLPEDILKKIYALLLQSKNIPLKIKKDIFISYNHANIIGLKRPKRN